MAHLEIVPTGSSTIPPRPRMPTDADQRRAEHQAARWSVLEEDFDELLEEWLEEHIDADRLQVWGPPDTSVNPLADMSRQLTTPGLYGVPPKVLHADELALALVGPEGFLDDAGLWTKLQQVQYYSVGLGDFLIRFDVLQDARRLAIRLVPPHNVWMRADEAEPDRPVEVWELRLRWFADRGLWIWAWDQFRLADPSLEGEPSYRVVGAATGEANLDGEDLSSVFLATDENPSGDFSGDRYPFRDGDEPILPWSIYRSVDTGQLWNWKHKRGAYRGTLNAALNWTFAQHAARDASGSTVFAVGVEPPAAGTRADLDRTRSSSSRARGSGTIRTIQLTPGSVVYHDRKDGDGQAFFHESGPGANLDSVSAYATLYEQKQAVRWGLNPADVVRTNANPMSGAALFVSTRGRREFAAQVLPLFRRSDLESIRIAAALLNAAGIGDFPTSGYSIAYHEIPESPGEEKAKREALEWDLEHGAITPVELVQARRPGISPADARLLAVEAEVQRRELDVAAAARLRAAGLPSGSNDLEVPDADRRVVVTVNEARALEGLEPVEGGDVSIAEAEARDEARGEAEAAEAAEVDDDSPAED
jgi:hypothetical protein